MATLTQTLSSSCDVLFPEPTPGDSTISYTKHSPLEDSSVNRYTVNSEAIYAAPSTSSYSTYSQEIRYIFDSNSGQARQINSSLDESDRYHSTSNSSNGSGTRLVTENGNSNRVPVTEEIYTPPTPSAVRRHQAPPTGYKTPSGSALVVTGYVKDENHNHHEVKVININNSTRGSVARQQEGLNRSYDERLRSHDNRSADNLLSPTRSHEPGRLSRGKVWYHRSLDHLATYDNNSSQGYKCHNNPSSHSNHLRQSIAQNQYGSGPHGYRNNNYQPTSGNLVHKPPVGQRPPGGQAQGHHQGHPGVHSTTHAHNSPGSLPRKLHWSLSAARRRTWSPPMFRKALGYPGQATLATMRCYHSNDALDALDTEENYYEDLDAVRAPPRLAPFSGQLGNRHVDKAVIRPIAFKPIIAPQTRYVPTPARSMLSPRQPAREPRGGNHDVTGKPTREPHGPHGGTTVTSPSTPGGVGGHGNLDDGYVSQDYNSGTHSHSTSNTSSSVSHNTSGQSHDPALRSHDHHPSPDSSMIYSPPNRKHKPLPEAPPPANHHLAHYGYIQTPSPSDSGVCDIEAMLREKDSEIQTLRETMANNEAVIFQVYEEKRQNYAMEIKEVHDEWSRRFRDHQQKAFKTEQALLLQMFKLQQERKTMKLDCETAKTEKESLHHKFEDLEGEHEKLNNKMEEIQWELVQKKGEISHLKSQLKQSNSDQTNRNNDLFGLKTQLKDAAKDTENKDAEILRLRTELELTTEDNVSLRREVEALREQLMVSRREMEPLREELTHLRLQNETLHKQHPPASSASPSALATTTTTSPPLSPMATNGPSLATSQRISPTVAMRTSSSPSDMSRRGEIEELRVELAKLKSAMEQTCAQFEIERGQWLDEKNKVIRYQKHLQLNYVQMYRKNKMLETEVEQLMVELENRDLKLTPENGPIAGESTC